MAKGWKSESARHSLARKGIKVGTKVELEHAKTIKKIRDKNLSLKEAAKQIALDHLAEDPAYYKKLAIVEAKQPTKKVKIAAKTVTVIKARLNKLLFSPAKAQTDPEILEIIIRADKAKYFSFLRGYTEWETKGRWHKLDEGNEMIEIQFRDRPDEKVGNELMALLTRYNKLVVKEDVLLCRTIPVEETTLK